VRRQVRTLEIDECAATTQSQRNISKKIVKVGELFESLEKT